jgi:cardiolipin synthase (CMP-forming)
VTDGVVESGTAVGHERVVTVPNALSVLRLLGVPLFVWLLLGPRADVWAIVVLGVGGITDWLDGKLARLLGQYSRLGALLDPAVDRLYILAALLAMGIRDVVPWWAVAVLIARDLVLAGCVLVLRRRGYGPFVVSYLGKAATFLLLYAFPLLLAGLQTGWFADICRPLGYAFAVWGLAFYLYTGCLYLAQFVLALRVSALRVSAPAGRTPPEQARSADGLGSRRDPGGPPLHR